MCKFDTDLKKCLKIFPVSDHFLVETTAVAFTSSQPGLRSLSAAPGTNGPILVATQHAELLIMDGEGQITIFVQVGAIGLCLMRSLGIICRVEFHFNRGCM